MWRKGQRASGLAPRSVPFVDRRDAGRKLAELLLRFRDQQPVVLALPRGGVPVGYEVARALGAPLDVFPVRKLGAPGHRELAIGAIATGGGRVVRVINDDTVKMLGVSRRDLEQVATEETRELERQVRRFRGDRPPPDLRGRTVILVDDGLATGATARAAIQALRSFGPRRIVLAAPVCPLETAATLRAAADEVICALTPADFYAVGLWYEDFRPTSDDEVVELLSGQWTVDSERGSRQAGPAQGPAVHVSPSPFCPLSTVD